MTLDITKDDIENIKLAIRAGEPIWENALLKDFKRKIKDYNRYLQSEQCCYCRRSLADEFNMVIDIEHVLPKSQFRDYMFETFNLSVSCKRCNMEIKREDVSFITDKTQLLADPKNTELYKFIHPNLDTYSSHINYISVTKDTRTIIKYVAIDNSAKAKFTYEYFSLEEIERAALNQAQVSKLLKKLTKRYHQK